METKMEQWNVLIEIDCIIEFDGNINSMDTVDHIQRNEIMSTRLFPIEHFKLRMFSNDIHH